MTIWKPAEIDVSGMERLAVHGFSGEHGNAIVNALQRRLWNNEFYSIVDRRPAEPIRPVSAGGEIGGPLSLDDLDAARRAGIDGLIVGDVIDFHCEDQPVSTQDQMREWIPQFRQENSNVDRDESRISAAGSTSRRHATVTVAFRLIHTESGRICLSRQISHSSSDLVDDRSHASPTATETLQILTRQCVDDFVCLLEPHPVTEPVKLAEPTLFQAGYSLVHNGNEFAIRGRWDEAIGAWEQALEAGTKALSMNPWDIATLLAMSDVCGELGADECQLFYLRWALDTSPRDVTVNRQAATILQRMGQFDQAIACWHRVEQAKPKDEEAMQAISRLSVEKTIHEGGYDPALLREGNTAEQNSKSTVASHSKKARQSSTNEEFDSGQTPIERLQTAIERDPTNTELYLQLSDLLVHADRFEEAERVLRQGLDASGGGDFQFRERIEDVQIRRVRHQLVQAEQQYEGDPTEANRQLVYHLQKHLNQEELEAYANRADRDPQNLRHKYELGIRLKRAGKPKEAIPILQAVRSDPKRSAQVLLELGECFQKIEQYKLALNHYEQALEACAEPDSETRRLALYRAGVLATGLRELDRAEHHLTELAGLDFSYRDVAERLDKINRLRDSE